MVVGGSAAPRGGEPFVGCGAAPLGGGPFVGFSVAAPMVAGLLTRLGVLPAHIFASSNIPRNGTGKYASSCD